MLENPEQERFRAGALAEASFYLRDHVFSGAMRTGHVVDLGAGEQLRNSLWLANHGFTVTAIDRVYGADMHSPHSNITLLSAEMSECDIPDADHGIAFFSLRFNERDVVMGVVNRMMGALRPGGLAIIQDFAMLSPDSRNLPGIWFDPLEVADVCRTYSQHVHVSTDAEPTGTIYVDESNAQIFATRSTIVAITR